MQATFVSGAPLMIDYTPGSAVAAGEVVVLNHIPVIAHRAISANALGSVAAGGGVYSMTGDAAIGAGKVIYWEEEAKKVTETAAGNVRFGYTAEACSGDDAAVKCVHQPAGTAAAATTTTTTTTPAP